MNIRPINQLIDKYFDGNTSIAEERQLRNFFLKEDVPGNLLPLKDYFVYLNTEKNTDKLDDNFDAKILDEISNGKRKELSTYRKLYVYIASGVAACVLIVIGLFNFIGPGINQNDIETAYAQTQKALIFVSSKLNQGMDKTKNMGKLNETLQKTNKVAAYDKGIKNIGAFSKLYETPNKIFNKKNK
jgi:hypothetical protein